MPTHLLRAVVFVLSLTTSDSLRLRPDSASCLNGPFGTSMSLKPIHLCYQRLTLGALSTRNTVLKGASLRASTPFFLSLRPPVILFYEGKSLVENAPPEVAGYLTERDGCEAGRRTSLRGTWTSLVDVPSERWKISGYKTSESAKQGEGRAPGGCRPPGSNQKVVLNQ